MYNDWDYSNYSKVLSEVEDHFPFENAREFQLETISEIYEAILKGYKYIVLEAGTGTGKSAIAATLALMSKSAYILTITKQLQDQYMDDFKKFNFALVKGRGNYPCLAYHKDKIYETCEMGRCKLEDYSCPHMVNSRTLSSKPKSSCCPFNFDKSVGILSDVVVTNYNFAYYDFNFSEGFEKRKLLIFDEAHNLENQIMGLFTLEFVRKDLKEEVGINLSKKTVNTLLNGDYLDWINFIERIETKYKEKINSLEPNKSNKYISKELKTLNRKVEEIDFILKHIKEEYENWIVDYDSYYKVLTFKPLKIDKFTENTFFKHGDICIFMSATILDYKLFGKWLGIDPNEIYAIRRKSPFDVKRNPIITFNNTPMSYNYLSDVAPKTIPLIKDILNKHKNDKGIIHTVSYQCKKFLKNKLNDKRLIDHKTSNREKVLDKFKKSEDALVLISPSMNQGVDLPEDQCRFQVMYKIPYPSLSDKQTKLRMQLERDWYTYQTCLNLIQTYGRGMRSQNDYCKTYFIDSRINSFINQNANFIPNSFINAIDAKPSDITVNSKEKLIKVNNNIDAIIANTTHIDFAEDNGESILNNYKEGLKNSQKSILDDEFTYNNKTYKNNYNEINNNLEISNDIISKYQLKKEGISLIKDKNYEDAIKFYNNLINHELYINDYYPYRKLVEVYRKQNNYEEIIKTILNFFDSGRYCDDYQYEWFIHNLKKYDEITHKAIKYCKKGGNTTQDVIDYCDEKYKSINIHNKDKINSPVMIAAKIRLYGNSFKIIPEDKFNKKRTLKKLRLKYKIAESEKNYEDAINYHNQMTALYNKSSFTSYRKLVTLYRKVKDYDKELSTIESYFKDNEIRKTESNEKYFNARYKEVKKILEMNKVISNSKNYEDNGNLKNLFSKELSILKDPNVILDKENLRNLANLFKNCPNFKDDRDFLVNTSEEIVNDYSDDEVNEKYRLIEKGKELERNNTDEEGFLKVKEFYESLIDNYYFKKDYYPYRRLGIIYNKSKKYSEDILNINNFFNKKLYCPMHQIVWFRNKVLTLEKLYEEDSSLFKDSKVNFILFRNIHEKIQEYIDDSIVPKDNKIPLAERIRKNDNDEIIVTSREKFEFIQHIYELKEYTAGFERRKEYDLAIKQYIDLFKENLLYFKYYSLYKLSIISTKISEDEFNTILKSNWDN